MEHQKTAILIFANSSKEEMKHKAIAKDSVLFKKLNQKTLCTVKKAKLPYFVFTEEEQIGHNFGERFTNAIQDIYAMGFDNVITIGNDSPQLTANHLLESAQQLQNNNFVLGPSRDGGFYLMGLHKSHFDKSSFLKLPWQTRELSHCISQIIENKNTEVVLLQTLFDIDDTSDLKKIVNLYHKIGSNLLRIITIILSTQSKDWNPINKQYFTIITARLFNKGSPQLI